MTYSKEFTNWVVKTNTLRRNDRKIGWSRLVNDKNKNYGFIMYDIRTGKVAYSHCNPDDDWCEDIGLAIAYARLRNISIPEMEALPTIEECVGKWVEPLGCGTIVYVTPIKNTVSILTLTRYGDKIQLNKTTKCKIIQ